MIEGVCSYQKGEATALLYQAYALDVLPFVCREAFLLSDPPYGMRYTARASRSVRATREVDEVIEGDFVPFDPRPFLVFKNTVLWGANWYANDLPTTGRWLCWDKREETTPDDGSDFELAWTSLPGKASRMHRQLWRGVCIRGEEVGRKRVHPMQKPIALMHWCLQQMGVKLGDTVFDPFAGSATVGVACLRLGVNYIGVECDAKHFATAATRLHEECTHQLCNGEA